MPLNCGFLDKRIDEEPGEKSAATKKLGAPVLRKLTSFIFLAFEFGLS